SIVFCTGLALTPVALAAAADKPIDPEKIFKRKDANSDGSLSLDEYKAGMKDRQLENAEKRFKKIDTNSDGKLSLEEFKAGMPKPKDA
ncbi:EF-hand domain-containing protein, partial [bacterium]|nr:EF-hand domain-containing protein [bacterium]